MTDAPCKYIQSTLSPEELLLEGRAALEHGETSQDLRIYTEAHRVSLIAYAAQPIGSRMLSVMRGEPSKGDLMHMVGAYEDITCATEILENLQSNVKKFRQEVVGRAKTIGDIEVARALEDPDEPIDTSYISSAGIIREMEKVIASDFRRPQTILRYKYMYTDLDILKRLNSLLGSDPDKAPLLPGRGSIGEMNHLEWFRRYNVELWVEAKAGNVTYWEQPDLDASLWPTLSTPDVEKRFQEDPQVEIGIKRLVEDKASRMPRRRPTQVAMRGAATGVAAIAYTPFKAAKGVLNFISDISMLGRG